MPEQLYSVEQVADLLGLHVKTVRNYVRDGRLKAVRIGKQYRIARADLEAFTCGPVAAVSETVRRERRVEVTSIVQIDAIDPDTMSRLSTLLISSANSRPGSDERLRVETIYEEERGSMKIIIVGGPESSAELLRLVNVLLEG